MYKRQLLFFLGTWFLYVQAQPLSKFETNIYNTINEKFQVKPIANTCEYFADFKSVCYAQDSVLVIYQQKVSSALFHQNEKHKFIWFLYGYYFKAIDFAHNKVYYYTSFTDTSKPVYVTNAEKEQNHLFAYKEENYVDEPLKDSMIDGVNKQILRRNFTDYQVVYYLSDSFKQGLFSYHKDLENTYDKKIVYQRIDLLNGPCIQHYEAKQLVFTKTEQSAMNHIIKNFKLNDWDDKNVSPFPGFYENDKNEKNSTSIVKVIITEYENSNKILFEKSGEVKSIFPRVSTFLNE